MEKTVILTINDTLEATLKKKHAQFHQLPKEQFNAIQQTFTPIRSMVYRTSEIELCTGESQVTYYSLCYKKNTNGTQYYVASAKLQVPPSEFLGEKEEPKVLQWFIKDKGNFLSGQPPTTNLSKQQLTEDERKEIDTCLHIFEQLEEFDEERCLQINSPNNCNELPTFDLGFKFLYP